MTGVPFTVECRLGRLVVRRKGQADGRGGATARRGVGAICEEVRVTHAAITFDTGALIALERRKDRAMKIYTHAKDRGFVVATPKVTVAEWWRGRSDRREAVWRGLLVEPPSDETVKLAGVALGKIRNATPIDAIVAAFAAQ
jgi:predicted nucleic acid-binding protein